MSLFLSFERSCERVAPALQNHSLCGANVVGGDRQTEK